MNAFDQIIEQIDRLRATYVDQRKMYEAISPDNPTLTQVLLSTKAAVIASDLALLRKRVEALRTEAEAEEELVKPWHGAKPGEVWVITYENVERYALVDDDCAFIFTDNNDGPTWLFITDPLVTGGYCVLEAL